MGNLSGQVGLIVTSISKNDINEKSLIEIFGIDNDLTENEDFFRKDTLKLGFENEAERVSAEIYKKYKKLGKDDEANQVEQMIKAVFEVKGFIGKSSYYGNYEYVITETDYEYVISIAYQY